MLSNSDYVVSFIKRQTNKVAYITARAVLSHLNLHVFSDAPATLYSLILKNKVQ